MVFPLNSKAFDTVSVSKLITKRNEVGVRGHSLKICESYLCDRTQCVRIGSITSEFIFLSYGVPQGSILGPTLFLIYINSLCKLCISNCSIYTYADDTGLLIHGSGWRETFNKDCHRYSYDNRDLRALRALRGMRP